jgi:hypothetical protein
MLDVDTVKYVTTFKSLLQIQEFQLTKYMLQSELEMCDMNNLFC